MKKLLYLFIFSITIVACDTQRRNNQETAPGLGLDENATKELTANTWKKTELKKGSVFDFEVTNDHKLLAATSEGLYMSEDEGESWMPIYSNDLNKKQVNCIAKSDSVLFAGVGGEGVYTSVDDGYTWQPMSEGIRPSRLIVKDIMVHKGIIYAGTSRGLFVSFNHGQKWVSANKGLPVVKTLGDSVGRYTSVSNFFAKNEQIFALTEAGLAVSKDEGNSWSFPKQDGINKKELISTLTGRDKYLFAGKFTKDGLYFSLDNGDTWQKTGLEGVNLYKVFVSPNQIVYAGTAKKGIFRSPNKGKDWNNLNKGLPKGTGILSFTSTPNGYILAGTENNGVFRLEK